ncbi:hypothetical protein B1B_10979, partial [mine drainage metagenome]
LKLHEEKGGTGPGRRYGLEVLNKSAVVLITSFWEAYCEDIAAEGLECIVTHAKASDVLPKEIKKIIARELKSDINELAIWDISDDKWRAVLRTHLIKLQETRNRKLNTPKHMNIDDLFESAIGLAKVSLKWGFKKRSPIQTRAKLDKFVELRGEIAHRGKAKSSVKKTTAVDYLELIKQVAARTGGVVNAHVKSITGGQALF